VEQEHQPRPRFDPQAALEELERFGRDIQRYRAQRQAVGDEFESFVRSFKTAADSAGVEERVPQPAPPRDVPRYAGPVGTAPVPHDLVERSKPVERTTAVEPVGAAAAAGAATPVVAAEPFTRPVEPVTPATALEPANALADTREPRAGEPVAASAVAAPQPPAPPAKVPAAAMGAGVLAVALGGALLAMFLWNRSPEADPVPAAAPDAPAASTPAPEPSPAPVAAATAPPRPIVQPAGDSEIVTERQVWMRVIVDGNKILEREVPAGTRIPLKAEKTIVIRTGDAGAVRLSLRGAPGALLGREGEVVTRAFNVPPRPLGNR
jgi:hypothetical protein